MIVRFVMSLQNTVIKFLLWRVSLEGELTTESQREINADLPVITDWHLHLWMNISRDELVHLDLECTPLNLKVSLSDALFFSEVKAKASGENKKTVSFSLLSHVELRF